MRRTITGSTVGALLVLGLIAPGGASADVFVRIEGAGGTLLPQTSVQTTNATQIKGNACSGSSAAGGLDVATNGNWNGSYSTSFNDYLISSILGETPTGNNFWTLWINGRSSQTGACSTPLAPGDRELWFDCQADASYNCTNNPLALSAPATTQRGQPLAVSVAQLDGNGGSAPVGGATVAGGGIIGTTDATGRATITPTQTGTFTLQATKPGATPSDPVDVCVSAGADGTCGTPDQTGPAVHVNGIGEHQVFSRGPRQLQGTAGPDPSGLANVRLSLSRRGFDHRCSYFDGRRAAWRRVSCRTTKPTPAFSAGAAATWSYLLPRRLTPGRYQLGVVARDGRGNDTRVQIGVSRIYFYVVPA